jgi:fatty acid desaturase
VNDSPSEAEELRQKIAQLGFTDAPVQRPGRARSPVPRLVVVAIVASLIWAAGYAVVVGWNIGHAPPRESGSVYSDPFFLCLFPFGELAYAVAALSRAWVSLFLGASAGQLVASTLVGVIAFPIGFFYGAIATAVAFGVTRLWGFVTGKREREQRRSSRNER